MWCHLDGIWVGGAGGADGPDEDLPLGAPGSGGAGLDLHRPLQEDTGYTGCYLLLRGAPAGRRGGPSGRGGPRGGGTAALL